MKMIRKIIKKLLNRDSNPELAAIKYAEAHGFTHGVNFHWNSGYPIDGNWPWLITVGDNVTLATGVKLLAHDASTAKAGVHTKIGIVQIGNNVFVGANSIVLPNVRIGDNVIIGAGSVISKDVPSNSVYAGNPAHLICTFSEYCEKHQNNQNDHPVFRQHTWQEWPDASKKERQEMRNKLKDTFGYI